MILKVKSDAVKVPVDKYNIECPNAIASDILTLIDKKRKIFKVEYAVWRNEQEMNADNSIEMAIATGSYEWSEQEVPATFQDNVMLTPKFGAFDTIFQNITIDNQGNTVFGDVGEQWLLLAINPYGDAWGINWQIEK